MDRVETRTNGYLTLCLLQPNRIHSALPVAGGRGEGRAGGTAVDIDALFCCEALHTKKYFFSILDFRFSEIKIGFLSPQKQDILTEFPRKNKGKSIQI